MSDTTARIHTLRAAGTALVVELTEPVPRVLHWGADPGELSVDALAALLMPKTTARMPSTTETTPYRQNRHREQIPSTIDAMPMPFCGAIGIPGQP